MHILDGDNNLVSINSLMGATADEAAETLIVSRHPAAIDFIRQTNDRFAQAPVVEVASATDVSGKDVAGNLPLHLAVHASCVYAVEFDGSPPRGAEYTIAEMQAAGAKLVRYLVCSFSDKPFAPDGQFRPDLSGE